MIAQKDKQHAGFHATCLIIGLENTDLDTLAQIETRLYDV